MRITKIKIQQIIKEELEKLKEQSEKYDASSDPNYLAMLNAIVDNKKDEFLRLYDRYSGESPYQSGEGAKAIDALRVAGEDVGFFEEDQPSGIDILNLDTVGHSYYTMSEDDPYEYDVEDNMWVTRRKDRAGDWISLSGNEEALSILDAKFPGVRQVDDEGGLEPIGFDQDSIDDADAMASLNDESEEAQLASELEDADLDVAMQMADELEKAQSDGMKVAAERPDPGGVEDPIDTDSDGSYSDEEMMAYYGKKDDEVDENNLQEKWLRIAGVLKTNLDK